MFVVVVVVVVVLFVVVVVVVVVLFVVVVVVLFVYLFSLMYFLLPEPRLCVTPPPTFPPQLTVVCIVTRVLCLAPFVSLLHLLVSVCLHLILLFSILLSFLILYSLFHLTVTCLLYTSPSPRD